MNKRLGYSFFAINSAFKQFWINDCHIKKIKNNLQKSVALTNVLYFI